ncbi:MAG: hypothetical protein M1504_01495 [Candidatus Marsarchaeota archaeon]|nr:hypothetical protein [Candidatus Marsarchaeota archaeon]
MTSLNSNVEDATNYLVKKQSDFDSVMTVSRDIIRGAGQSITLLHNNKDAKKSINEMSEKVKALKKMDGLFKYQTQQAYQEYAEALIFQSIKEKKKIPSSEELEIEYEPYLLGLMDVFGELKREILEVLRESDVKKAEEYLEIMKEIYDTTRKLRFAEAILPGFRKKQDVARIQIESAGSEILVFKGRHSK